MRERKLRKSAIIRLDKRVTKSNMNILKYINALSKDVKVYRQSFNECYEGIKDENKRVLQKENNLEGLSSQARKLIGTLETFVGKFDYIQGLAEAPEKEFNKYVKKLKKIVDESDLTQQTPHRLASLETRITRLEIKGDAK